MRRPLEIVIATAWVLMACLDLGVARATAETPARVEGRVEVGIRGLELSSLGPVIVYLESLDPDTPVPAPTESVTIRQKNARFSPAFRVVSRGQRIEMPNQDSIFHNVFSYSPGNEFDLGVYPGGESRSVKFDRPGVVRTYCSIHESMNATLLVVPTAWYAAAKSDGRFVISDVPAGRYRLRTWCERLPETSRVIEVGPGGLVVEGLVLGAGGS